MKMTTIIMMVMMMMMIMMMMTMMRMQFGKGNARCNDLSTRRKLRRFRGVTRTSPIGWQRSPTEVVDCQLIEACIWKRLVTDYFFRRRGGRGLELSNGGGGLAPYHPSGIIPDDMIWPWLHFCPETFLLHGEIIAPYWLHSQ